MKYNLPDLYVSESSEFDRLYRLGNTRSTTGNITFTSSSSNTSYSSITGQLGIMHQLEAILAPYKINASDWNDLEDMFISHKAEMSIHLAGGTANTITISTGGDFQYQQGKWLQFKATANSTGNVTINVDDKGAKPFLKLDGSQIASGGVKSLKVYKAYYDTGSGGRFFLLASAEGNAVAVDVLAGKTFSNDDDVGIVGTMPNLGTVNNTITTQNGQYTIPEGYHNGDGKVIANFANLKPSNLREGINVGGVIGELSDTLKNTGIINISAQSGLIPSQGEFLSTIRTFPTPAKAIAIEHNSDIVKAKFFNAPYREWSRGIYIVINGISIYGVLGNWNLAEAGFHSFLIVPSKAGLLMFISSYEPSNRKQVIFRPEITEDRITSFRYSFINNIPSEWGSVNYQVESHTIRYLY